MQSALHTRGPLIVSAMIFGLGLGALGIVSATSPQQITQIDRVSGYGLVALANAAQP